MADPVSLKDVVDAMDFGDETWGTYLNRNTGEILTASEEDHRLAEDDGLDVSELPEWQQEHVLNLRKALDSDEWLALPGKFEIHEWAIMDRFTNARTRAGDRDALLDAIHGRGAFRHFKTTIRRLRIEEEWYRFRESALEQIAKDWLVSHAIPYR
jgi:hypothetical protein